MNHQDAAHDDPGDLTRVAYRFELADTPHAQWHVRNVDLTEQLSALYEAKLQLVSLHHDDPDKLLGASCSLTMERMGATRHLHGIVARVGRGELAGDATLVQITVAPALAALRYRSDTRIFGGSTQRAIGIPEVLQTVLAAALKPYERSVSLRLSRAEYPRREYIAQYRETDLAFVQRLMAEEGIWYYFDHETDPARETLVLVDSNDAACVPTLGDDNNELPLHLTALGPGYWQSVTKLVRHDALGPTGLTVRDYNWTQPELARTPQKVWPQPGDSSGSLRAAEGAPADGSGPRSLYQPYGLTFSDYDADAKAFRKLDTDDQARLQWELTQSRAVEVIAEGNVLALCPGQKVCVKGHPAGLDGDWLVLSVHGRGAATKSLGDGDEGEDAEFRSSFVCIPFATPFRPSRLCKPRVEGIQTAVVVGPDGRPDNVADSAADDIHTDEHGRIQVKFPWDRTPPGGLDATTTCFLRVAQTWGGSGWGFVFIPRIGMEVIVSFIDGDPDKPLVTGCVYNGLNQAFHPLPADKTKSYIRTSSSPGNDGFNELCFEDKKGHEQLSLHAQRDLKEHVGRDHTTVVMRNGSLNIRGDETHSVQGRQDVVVTKNRLVVVGGEAELEVTEKATEHYHGGRERRVEHFDNTTTIKAHKNTNVDGQYNVHVASHFSVEHDGNQLFLADKLSGKFSDRVEFKVGANLVAIDKDGTITFSAEKELVLRCGGSRLRMKYDGTIEVTGNQAIDLQAGGSTLRAEPAGVTIAGKTISSVAKKLHEIGGERIQIG